MLYQAERLTGSQVKKLMDFVDQLLTERLPDTLENILY
jgi:hypothetical protein